MKKILCTVLVVVMCLTSAPIQNFFNNGFISNLFDIKASASGSIKVGDTITLGTYNDKRIVWECVDIDENGPLMMSKEILCEKEYDAAGADGTYHTDGWSNIIRTKYGSSCWYDSNIRQWLNSDETSVSWTHCPPSYSNEAGFLTNFTAEEKTKIKKVNRIVNVNIWESKRAGYCDGGTSDTVWNTLRNQNFDPKVYYYKNIEDTIFLLNSSQYSNLYNNNMQALKSTSTYWGCVNGGNNYACFEHVMYIRSDGIADVTSACSSFGIRPAFYLDVATWKTEYYVTGILNGSSNMPKIAIDGIWYEYDTTIPNLAETIDRFAIGSTICCKISSGKIVACSEYKISNGAVATINTGNVNSVKYHADSKKYDVKNIDLGISITNKLVSSTYGTINTDYLAGYDVTFDKVILKSSEKDLLCFKNGLFKSDDTEINLEPVVLKAGNVHWLGEKTQMIVNDDYNWSNNETKKEVIITALMCNGTKLVASDTEKITFINQAAIDNLKNTQEAERESQIAANLLNNTASVIFNSFLSEIFTTNELKTIQNALECKTALCALPKSVYEKAGIEEKIMNKLMGRLGVDKDWFGSRYTADISLKVLVDTQKYGQLEITFKAPVTFISFGSDNPFAGVNFDISYEITGGKGKSKVDKQFHKGSHIGALTYANVSNFSVSVQKIALAQLESAYNCYGDDLNKVGEMLMGETFTKILSKTSAKSYSHLTFTMITFPSKQISIHCPVDVYMYDENGKLCVSIVDNEIQQECDDVDVLVLGDEKFISVYDGKYSLKVVATAIDTMDITIEEYSTENEKIRTTTFDDIALQPGDSFNAEITETYIEDTCELEKNEIETIKSDKDDILIHCAVPVEKIEKEATCSEEGSKHTECEVCEEVLSTETIAKVPHSYISTATQATCTKTGSITYLFLR